jgi:Polyketide cyclase / dehydrase and lipid transport
VASVQAQAVVPIAPDLAFAVSQTSGAVRYRWDPFVHEQHFLHNAEAPGKGVQTFTRQRFGLSMVSEYVSFAPPTNVGMKMVTGPWFFDMFGGGWRFTPAGDGSSTQAVWRYSFRCRPGWLRPVAEPIGRVVLGREIRRRLAGYVRGCHDEVVLAAARATLNTDDTDTGS